MEIKAGDKLIIDKNTNESYFEIKETDKPPLGLKPRNIFEINKKEAILNLNKNRVLEILQAIQRYLEADEEIPEAWCNEILEINLELNYFLKKVKQNKCIT